MDHKGNAAVKMANMTKEKALKILDMPAGVPLTTALIAESFAHAMKRNHPDTTDAAVALPADDSPTRICWTVDSIMAARAYLRQVVADHEFPCRQCNGRGRVPFKLGTATCGACKGTGDRAP